MFPYLSASIEPHGPVLAWSASAGLSPSCVFVLIIFPSARNQQRPLILNRPYLYLFSRLLEAGVLRDTENLTLKGKNCDEI